MRYVLSLCRLIKIQPTNKDKIKSIVVIPIAKTSNWIKICPINFFLWIKMAAGKENKNMVLSLKPYRFQMCSTESRENERNVLKRFFFFFWGGAIVGTLSYWTKMKKSIKKKPEPGFTYQEVNWRSCSACKGVLFINAYFKTAREENEQRSDLRATENTKLENLPRK